LKIAHFDEATPVQDIWAWGAARRFDHELLKDKDPKTIFSSEGMLGELKKDLAESSEGALRLAPARISRINLR
jgi:hypothetical protein